MKVIMKHLLLGSIDQIENFLNTNKKLGINLEISSVKDKYDFIRRVLFNFGYVKLDKGEKHIILKYLKYFTRYSKAHLKRRVIKCRQGRLYYNPIRKRNRFSKKYFPSDIALLIKTDTLHDCLSGEATKRILEREFKKFGRIVYGNISNISSAHIYNIKNNNLQYGSSPAKLLNKIHIELTKSRSRHSNGNALVESKNGSIIKKFYGRNYIDQKWAKRINKFNRKYFNIYLNYHRPCGFATDKIDSKGKIRKKYQTWITPYEKLKTLKDAEQYLKPEFSFDELDKTANKKSDNEFAEKMREEKSKLFKIIFKK